MKERINDGTDNVQCLNARCNRDFNIAEDYCPYCKYPRIDQGNERDEKDTDQRGINYQ